MILLSVLFIIYLLIFSRFIIGDENLINLITSESLKMRMNEADSKSTERAYSDKSGEHGAVAESLDRYVLSW